MKIFFYIFALSLTKLEHAISEEDFRYIEEYKNEAKGLVNRTQDPKLFEEVKQSPNYSEIPKESNLGASELKIKADNRIKGIGEKELSDQEKAERDAI